MLLSGKREVFMAKIFNVNGDCKPNLHYMVNISERLRQIKNMVDEDNTLRLTVQGNMAKQQHCVL